MQMTLTLKCIDENNDKGICFTVHSFISIYLFWDATTSTTTTTTFYLYQFQVICTQHINFILIFQIIKMFPLVQTLKIPVCLHHTFSKFRLSAATTIYPKLRLLSTSSTFYKGNEDGSKGDSKLDMSTLLNSETPPGDTTENVQNFLEKLKPRKNVPNRRKKIKSLNADRWKQGEAFLFKNEVVGDVTPEGYVNDTDITDRSTSTEKSIKAVREKLEEEMLPEKPIPVKEPLKVEQLKESIAQADNRSVSKLMSALINEIDGNVPEPTDKLKILMTAMSSQKLDNHKFKKRHKIVPATELFFGFELSNYVPDSDVGISLHEKEWLQNVKRLLPEVVPQNPFEVSMLNLDKQWNFPVDNEQDMGIEEVTSFEEHVFLDYMLEEFPEEGSLRKFMELVVTGLQQNPYLNVAEKEARVMWFKEYFETFPEEDLSL